MNFKPVLILIIIVSLVLQLKNCSYGPEKQDVEPKYKPAHLTAVSAQNLLKEGKTQEALEYYHVARRELEHPDVGGDLGEDIYINYGFVLNEIGTIHLSWGMYGRELNTSVIDDIDTGELEIARESLEEAVAFYKRWWRHNNEEQNYERYAGAIANSLTNLGIAHKYLGDTLEASGHFKEALRYDPSNGNAERSLNMLGISAKPYIEEGKERAESNERFKIF